LKMRCGANAQAALPVILSPPLPFGEAHLVQIGQIPVPVAAVVHGCDTQGHLWCHLHMSQRPLEFEHVFAAPCDKKGHMYVRAPLSGKTLLLQPEK